MSRRARYPLQTLLQLREHRTEKARQALLEQQRVVQACRDECTRIEGEIADLARERQQQRGQLLAPPPPGLAWPAALAQREHHIDHLADLAVAARQRLTAAQQRLREAEAALEQARQAFFRAKSRQDALEKRKDVWTREQRTIESRREEAMAAELGSARINLN